MSPSEPRQYPLAEILKAQQALRESAQLPPELFPLPAFIGMVSDEIEALRAQGRDDHEIARIISSSSAIEVDAATIAASYASPEERHGHTGGSAS